MTHFVTYQKSDGLVVGSGSAGKNSTPIENDEFGVLEVLEVVSEPSRVINGSEVIALSSSEVESLEFSKKHKAAKKKITEVVGNYRNNVATSLPFQDQAYLNKREEALAFLGDTSQDPKNFPLLDKISTIRGLTPEDMAKVWTRANSSWMPILNKTEVARENALASLSVARTTDDINNLLETLRLDLEESINAS